MPRIIHLKIKNLLKMINGLKSKSDDDFIKRDASENPSLGLFYFLLSNCTICLTQTLTKLIYTS